MPARSKKNRKAKKARNPVSPELDQIERAHRAFHGASPSRVVKVGYDLKNLEHLWVLGRAKFIAYEPAQPSRRAGKIFVHHFGDEGDHPEAHEACEACGMLYYKRPVSKKRLPMLGVTRDGKVMLIVGRNTRVGPQGIEG